MKKFFVGFAVIIIIIGLNSCEDVHEVAKHAVSATDTSANVTTTVATESTVTTTTTTQSTTKTSKKATKKKKTSKKSTTAAKKSTKVTTATKTKKKTTTTTTSAVTVSAVKTAGIWLDKDEEVEVRVHSSGETFKFDINIYRIAAFENVTAIKKDENVYSFLISEEEGGRIKGMLTFVDEENLILNITKSEVGVIHAGNTNLIKTDKSVFYD